MKGSLVSCAACIIALTAGPVFAQVRACDPPPPDRLSPEIAEALRPSAPDSTYGFRARARRILENRRAVAAGTMTRAEADARGGLAMTGQMAFPVIPFLYSNTGAPPYPKGNLDDQLFTGPWPTGTLNDYYQEVSYGLFGVTGVVSDWVQLPNPDTYYEDGQWGMGQHGTKTAWESCILADDSIDFSQFDNDGDDGMPNSGDDNGIVDFAVFVSPEIDGVCDKYKNGICGTMGVANQNIWAHATSFQYWFGQYFHTDDPAAHPADPDVDGNIVVNTVLIVGGLTCDGTQNGIAVFAHEMGHALGVADLYDIDPWPTPDSRGIGRWGLMSTGTWNTPDRPSHMTAWTKERLGWLNYFNVNQDITNLCLPPVELDPIAVRLWTQGEESSEYFVVENRQPLGFDEHVLGRGLVVYHVDDFLYAEEESTNTVNASEAHKAIDVECADAYVAGHVPNADQLDDLTNCGDSGDPWCAATQTTFDGSSVPDTRAYDDTPTGVAIRNIGACDAPSAICADYEVGVATAANLCMHDCAGDGCAEITSCDTWWASPDLWLDNGDGNGNSYPAEGLMNRLHFRVRNVGPSDLAGVKVDLFYREPGTGLWWPDTGTLIETVTVPDILVSNGPAYEGSADFVYPTPPAGVDHYCLGALARHTLDPQNSTYPPADNNVVQVNHQVFVERAEGGGLRGACGAFQKDSRILVYGRTSYGRNLEMRLGSPPNFDDAFVPAGWNLQFDPGPYLLAPGEEDTVMVSMSAPAVAHGDTAHVPLTWWDIENGVAAGGILLDYRIDCFAPAAVAVQSAECLGPSGDYHLGPTVKLSWDRAQLDEQGTPEVVKYYEVHRSDDQGHPEALVERVAIDAETGETGFQWYDRVAPDSATVFTYRVRAVDAADNVGAFSAPIVADCSLAGVGVEPLATPGGLFAFEPASPNPFRGSTSFAFTLERPGDARVEVFDLAGRRVRTLAAGPHGSGRWSVRWDGRTEAGEPAPSGIYMVRLQADGRTAVQKVSLIR